mmetsp:Transcript_113008/g.326552  ORF Transcript_113008/g.326552 Transcript_113008/m.326552 type:complete len:242 (-) Transcript_113008:255-980(-)
MPLWSSKGAYRAATTAPPMPAPCASLLPQAVQQSSRAPWRPDGGAVTSNGTTGWSPSASDKRATNCEEAVATGGFDGKSSSPSPPSSSAAHAPPPNVLWVDSSRATRCSLYHARSTASKSSRSNASARRRAASLAIYNNNRRRNNAVASLSLTPRNSSSGSPVTNNAFVTKSCGKEPFVSARTAELWSSAASSLKEASAFHMSTTSTSLPWGKPSPSVRAAPSSRRRKRNCPRSSCDNSLR